MVLKNLPLEIRSNLINNLHRKIQIIDDPKKI